MKLKMNEPWTNVSTKMRSRDGIPYRSTIATDRLGFRRVMGTMPISKESASEDRVESGRKHLLLVEDSDDDAMLFSLAARRSPNAAIISRAVNTAQARQILVDSTPGLIALDCHLQGESGLDILSEIRADERFRMVPVVMLSGTESDAEVREAYVKGANSFLRKPFDCDEYVSNVRLLLEYWLEKNCVSINSDSPALRTWVG